MRTARAAAVTTVAALILAGCSTEDNQPENSTPKATSPIDWNLPDADRYHRTATYPVYLNKPAEDPVDKETVAEISTVTPDGNTVIYTDAAAKRIGFLDITDPAKPVGKGTLSLAELGHKDDQPTSVAAVNDHVLVVVDTTGGDFAHPSGRVDIVRIADRTRVHSIDLGGQPDSIAINPDGTFAAIAMENQRNEEFTPTGKEEGDLPQPPTGFVQLIDLTGAPNTWTPRKVDFDVEAARIAGLDTPEDLEPEYVSINSRGQVAVTLQENNGIAVLDGHTGQVAKIFSAGSQSVTGIDTKEDAAIDQTGSIEDTPREPDAIGWIGDDYVATANEGDWKGGTRGWTIFDAGTGKVVWDAGNSLEQLAVRTGLHIESRAESKGPEPEGLAITTIGGRPVALIASERSNFVAVYDVSEPAAPRFRQILPTTPGPEGVLPIPSRNLLAISSESDDAEARVRASITIYGYGDDFKAEGKPDFPSIVSGDIDGAPIGWGALGALSADPKDDNRLYTATDIAYGPARILGIDVAHRPALIDTELPVTEGGKPVTLDTEGVSARSDGGFVLAVEGEDGAGNQIVYVAADGHIEKRVSLPKDIAAQLGSQGFEGVTVDGDAVWVALQRELKSDPKGIVRIGRYIPDGDKWDWFGYQLDTTATKDDWLGVSEIAVHDGELLVLERDKLNGPEARVKALYRVAIPENATNPTDKLDVLPKTLARNLLPDLQATNGYVQEKVEGFAIAGNQNLYVVTDNDGLDDANGETVFLDLGAAPW
ncbi:alkaline phosphatase [Mycolicibacterium conceptionense]|uniref:Alkaline phosphatase n=1 Tax=Mycolicibacterium conceptionense TaxID=451644 RepID=A0A1A1YTH4_9MYCO|nr:MULTISPECIES: esterase-like activity of phytase family protein [Mycolicibacterium]MCW1819739.1 esterase-like activity of phytase family protein [Mycolicibacterium senegalense]OBB04567.1 alkaline phosphatase [Mycolicibacterium conceptionense]OBE93820.1 alkaline phosphatase [Mycolicibacterium conceptionense]OBF15146.1 alkaline phosphatase [Mycolicibacterium conceptionense]OBF34610.1 alkaline phosphatase [Mycolicibacterium conceptionense]